MNRIHGIVVLLAVGSLPAVAQRLDGCPEQGAAAGITAPSGDVVDRGLRDAGYTPTRASTEIALADPRAEVRSLAALKLGKDGDKANLALMMKAWLAEKDTCTKTIMRGGLSTLVFLLSVNTEEHPGSQLRVTPFQTCRASQPQMISLTLEQVNDPNYLGPAVRISTRNETPQTLAFATTPTPTELFSVTVLDPAGAPAKIIGGQERLYGPVGRDLGLAVRDHSTMFVPLPPQEDVAWGIWRIGEDFDMSALGTYQVRIGGRIHYLDTTVCSNTALVTVGK
jgi:hypothetical protein